MYQITGEQRIRETRRLTLIHRTHALDYHLVVKIQRSNVVVYFTYGVFDVFGIFIGDRSRILQKEILSPIAPEKTGIGR